VSVPKSRKSRRPVTLAAVPFGCEGRVELRQRMIDCPTIAGTKATATVNIRATPLEHMAARQRIDAAEKQAGDKFAFLYRTHAIGRSRAIVYQERVDGGWIGDDPLSDSVMRAAEELNEAMQAVGKIAAPIVVAILGEERTIGEVAKLWTDAEGIVSGERAEGFVTGILVSGLRALVEHWGLESRPRPKLGFLALGRRNGATYEPQRETIRASGEIAIAGPAPEGRIDVSGTMIFETRRPADRLAALGRHGAGSARKGPKGKRK
jgi:hypothetical protein